jgi:SRSO17 transposase
LGCPTRSFAWTTPELRRCSSNEPKGEAAPTAFRLATVGRNISFRGLVDLAELCWGIERDYHDLKHEIGLGHYEAAAGGALIISERKGIPLSRTFRR